MSLVVDEQQVTYIFNTSPAEASVTNVDIVLLFTGSEFTIRVAMEIVREE